MIKQAQPTFSWQLFGRLLFQHRKNATVYGLVFVAVSINLCLFLPANMRTPAAEQLVNAGQLLCFGVMGIINVWFFTRRNFLAELSISGVRLAYISLLFIAIALVLFIYYYISGNNSLIMAFASSSAFLLPFIIYQGFAEFVEVPVRNYPVWYLPEIASPPALLAAFTINSMQVQMRITRAADSPGENTFPVTASGKTKLGRVFEKFIAENNVSGSTHTIDLADTTGHAFGWQFFEWKFGGMMCRYLNPALSLLENHIKPNAIIVVIRTAAR